MSEIDVVRDFGHAPAGRHRADGPRTGEHFREELLLPRLRAKDDDRLIVILDGAAGYPGSFLEEAFGGLVRAGFTPSKLRERMVIRASDRSYQPYVEQIWKVIDGAAQQH